MGRFVLGVCLLAALLVLGIWTSSSMTDVHQTICQTLEDAAEKAVSGELNDAAALVQQAKQEWEQRWNRTATMADHEPMDEIDGLLAQLESFVQTDCQAEFAALCRRLSKLIDAVGEAHSLTWWNLLSYPVPAARSKIAFARYSAAFSAS